MGTGKVREIEQAIGSLDESEMSELYAWLEQNRPLPFDERVSADLAAWRLDAAIFAAIEEEKSGQTRAL